MLIFSPVFIAAPIPVAHSLVITQDTSLASTTIPKVHFYSQFKDITSPKWKKVGCGVTSLAMIIDFYKPGTVVVDTLLKQAVASGAYQANAGWTHKGLVALSNRYGLSGNSYDLSSSSQDAAFTRLKSALATGPVIASVHYKFEPANPIPHMVVITAIVDGRVYYNDPAATSGTRHIPVGTFLSSWKQKYIVLTPTPLALVVV